MDQHEVVRKSIVRISFKWPTNRNNNSNKRKLLTVVICGIIVSIKDDGSCLVIADPMFFHQENCPFVVNLPIAEGYDAVPVAPSTQFMGNLFCALVVQANGYVRPVTVETGAVRTSDDVNAFVFPREDFFAPPSFWPGYVVFGEEGRWGELKIYIRFHSYAHFGSPIFNHRGHLVGICHDPMDAWSVSFIQNDLFSEADIMSVLGNVSYVLNGNPIPPEVPIQPEGSALSV